MMLIHGLRAKANITENMIEIEKPQQAKAIIATCVGPKSAIAKLRIAIIEKIRNISFESINLTITNPNKQPMDINPQNQATVVAPAPSGLTP